MTALIPEVSSTDLSPEFSENARRILTNDWADFVPKYLGPWFTHKHGSTVTERDIDRYFDNIQANDIIKLSVIVTEYNKNISITIKDISKLVLDQNSYFSTIITSVTNIFIYYLNKKRFPYSNNIRFGHYTESGDTIVIYASIEDQPISFNSSMMASYEQYKDSLPPYIPYMSGLNAFDHGSNAPGRRHTELTFERLALLHANLRNMANDLCAHINTKKPFNNLVAGNARPNEATVNTYSDCNMSGFTNIYKYIKFNNIPPDQLFSGLPRAHVMKIESYLSNYIFLYCAKFIADEYKAIADNYKFEIMHIAVRGGTQLALSIKTRTAPTSLRFVDTTFQHANMEVNFSHIPELITFRSNEDLLACVNADIFFESQRHRGHANSLGAPQSFTPEQLDSDYYNALFGALKPAISKHIRDNNLFSHLSTASRGERIKYPVISLNTNTSSNNELTELRITYVDLNANQLFSGLSTREEGSINLYLCNYLKLFCAKFMVNNFLDRMDTVRVSAITTTLGYARSISLIIKPVNSYSENRLLTDVHAIDSSLSTITSIANLELISISSNQHLATLASDPAYLRSEVVRTHDSDADIRRPPAGHSTDTHIHVHTSGSSAGNDSSIEKVFSLYKQTEGDYKPRIVAIQNLSGITLHIPEHIRQAQSMSRIPFTLKVNVGNDFLNLKHLTILSMSTSSCVLQIDSPQFLFDFAFFLEKHGWDKVIPDNVVYSR